MKFSCTECEKTFETKTGLSNHSRKHKKKSGVTQSLPPIPDRATTEAVGILTHKELQNHSTDGNKMVTDDEPLGVTTESKNKSSPGAGVDDDSKDLKSFTTMQDLHTCLECGKTFRSRRSLGNHKRVHSKNPSIDLPSSRRSSLQPSSSRINTNEDLTNQNKINTISIELPTSSTDSSNSSTVGYGKLELESSISANEKGDGHRCEECDQIFPTKRGLANHRRVHKWQQKPQRSVDTWEPPEVDKLERNGSGILTTSETSYDQVFKSENEDKKPRSEETNIAGRVRSNTADNPFDRHEEDTDDKTERDADDTAVDDEFTIPSDAEITELAEKLEQSIFVTDESDQENNGGRQIVMYNQKTPDDCKTDIKDFDDDEEEMSDSFYSLSDEDDEVEDLLENLSLNDLSVCTPTSETQSIDVFDDTCSEPSTPSLAESLREDRTPTRTSEIRNLDEIVGKNKLKKKEKSHAAKVVNHLIRIVLTEMKKDSPDLEWKHFNSGSYYDNSKNGHPDEFDVMIFPTSIKVKVEFESTSTVAGFYKVKFESPRLNDNFKRMMHGEYLHPKKYKDYVFGKLDAIFDSTACREFRSVKRMQKSDDSSPAYTIIYSRIVDNPIDIDLVPAFVIDGTAPIARQIDPKWMKRDKIVNKLVKYYDIVAKTCPDDTALDRDLLWRLSFSYSEKQLIKFAADGNRFSKKKTIFRIMKEHIQTIKKQYPNDVKKFCSYHIKQFMLSQFDNEWRDSDSVKLHRAVLKNFTDALSAKPPFIENYFIAGDNVIKFVPKTEIDLIVKYCTSLM